MKPANFTWIPNAPFNLPENIEGRSERVLVALENLHGPQHKPDILLGHYDFHGERWRTNMGPIDRKVTHYAKVPFYPDYQGA